MLADRGQDEQNQCSEGVAVDSPVHRLGITDADRVGCLSYGRIKLRAAESRPAASDRTFLQLRFERRNTCFEAIILVACLRGHCLHGLELLT